MSLVRVPIESYLQSHSQNPSNNIFNFTFTLVIISSTIMTVPEIRNGEKLITDPFLNSVLDVSSLTRDQCLALFNLAETYPVTTSTATPSRETRQHSIKQHKLLNAYLSQLRGLNREAIIQVRQAKQATAEARQEVDRLHLQLQNLYYEQRHLRAEIAACEAFE